MPNALIAWPIVFDAANYTLRVSIDTVEQNLNFGGSGMTLGRYYWVTGDAQADADGGVYGVGDLLTMLATCCNLHTSASVVTVTMTAAFRVQVAVGGGSIIQLLWDHASTTLDPAIFGFTGDTASSASVTGANLPMGIWRPGVPLRRGPRPQNAHVGGVGRAISGRTRVSWFGQQDGVEWPLRFHRLLSAITMDEYAAGTTPTGTLQSAWDSALARGYAFRVFEDEADITDDEAYTLLRVTDHTAPWEREGNTMRWEAEIPAAEVVA